MESTLSYVNDNLDLIAGAFSLLILFRSTFSFFSSRNIERQFYSKEKKFLFEFLNLLIIFIIAPTLLCFAIYSEGGKISLFINRYFGYFGLLLLITCGIIILKKLFLIFKKKNAPLIRKNSILRFLFLSKRMRNQKFNLVLNLVLGLLFFLSVYTVFGALNVDIIQQKSSANIKILLISIFLLLELYLVYVVIVWANDFKLTQPVVVTIKMDDGQEYKNYYIYHPSHQKYILIGKTKSLDKCLDPILINTEKIMSCAQVNTQI